MQHVKFYARYMKVMLEVFGLKYVDIENKPTNWKVKKNVEKSGHKRLHTISNV
jgi:hypothetical protein